MKYTVHQHKIFFGLSLEFDIGPLEGGVLPFGRFKAAISGCSKNLETSKFFSKRMNDASASNLKFISELIWQLEFSSRLHFLTSRVL